MEILIIEDELKTARSLARLIEAAGPENRILKTVQSLQAAVAYLSEAKQPELIFMDIQLADGICFEIFKQVEVKAPIIFCTAFDEYLMEAFKANGIAYILKPFSPETIAAALAKASHLKSFFLRNGQAAGISDLLEKLQSPTFKKSFLVFSKQKYQTIPTSAIAYFYIRNSTSTLVTLEGEEYPLTQTLEEIHGQLSEQDFFRLNRQYLIAFQSIREVEHYFARKLNITLKLPVPEKLLVGKDKASVFLDWLDRR